MDMYGMAAAPVESVRNAFIHQICNRYTARMPFPFVHMPAPQRRVCVFCAGSAGGRWRRRHACVAWRRLICPAALPICKLGM